MILLSCGDDIITYTYYGKYFDIKIPKGWILKEGQFKFMPINVRSKSTLTEIVPNYNITLINLENKTLKEFVKINTSRNCSNGECTDFTQQIVKINNKVFYKTSQSVKIDNKYLKIVQYYTEHEQTVYLLSFFCLVEDFEKNNEIFNEVAFSLIIK